MDGLLHRAYRTCSSWKKLHQEFNKIKDILKSNGYPENLINKTINTFLNRKFTDRVIPENNDTTKYTFKLPYIGQPSLLFKKKLVKLFKTSNIDINVVFTSVKVGQYFSLKCKTDSVLKSKLVYQFQCPDDPGAVYIGKTKRFLHQRVDEHRKTNSPLSSHISTCQHCRHHDNLINAFSTLAKANSDFDLQITEAIKINECRPKLNTQLANAGSSYFLNIF